MWIHSPLKIKGVWHSPLKIKGVWLHTLHNLSLTPIVEIKGVWIHATFTLTDIAWDYYWEHPKTKQAGKKTEKIPSK